MTADTQKLNALKHHLPYPIAWSWHQCGLVTPKSADHIKRLISCTQITLRTLTALALNDYLRGQRLRDDWARLLHEAIKNPTDGRWAALLQRLQRALGGRAEAAFFPELSLWYEAHGSAHFDVLLQTRNKSAHDANPRSEAQQAAEAEHLEGHLCALLCSLEWLAQYPILRIMPGHKTLPDQQHQGRVQLLTGREFESTPLDARWSAPLADGLLYVAAPRRKELLVLAPWARVADPDKNGERFYLCNGISKDGDALHMTWIGGDAALSTATTADPWMGERANFKAWWEQRERRSPLVHDPVLSESLGARPEGHTRALPAFVPTAPMTPPKPPKPPGARRAQRWGAAALLALAGVVGVALVLNHLRQPKQPSWTDAASLALSSKERPPEKAPTKDAQQLTTALGGAMRFVKIKPGTFSMGSPDAEEGRASGAAERLHKVTLTRPFAMQETEVTINQWTALMGGDDPSPRDGCGLHCPIVLVSWWDALVYANKLSEHEGLKKCYTLTGCNDLSYAGKGCVGRSPTDGGWCGTGGRDENLTQVLQCEGARFHGLDCDGYRLPTEAEWEYAARAGTDGPTYRPLFQIADMSVGARLKNGECDHLGARYRVGRHEANRWGLHDMIGNVAEWVWDSYASYSGQPETDPIESADGQRVFRGGSACVPKASMHRAASRLRSIAHNRSRAVGFRLARTLPR